MWSEEEKDKANKRAEAAYIGVREWDDDVRADCMRAGMTARLHHVAANVMDLAVELASARGGTMTAEELNECQRLATSPPARHGWDDETVAAMLKHLSAQGARVAVLERQVLEEGGKFLAEIQRADQLQERLSAADESVRDLTRRAQQAEGAISRERAATAMWRKRVQDACDLMPDANGDLGAFDIVNRVKRLQERCAALSAAGQVLSEHVDSMGLDNTGRAWADQMLDRYPCSSTCTHDDAKTPGHAERVRERSEAVKALSEKVLPGPDVIDGGPGTRGPIRLVSTQARVTADSYAEGAEAMRAACLEAVMQVVDAEGAGSLADRLKSAIEGAAP
jgi:hypothetical protein